MKNLCANKAIFYAQRGALQVENNEISVKILPINLVCYCFFIPKDKDRYKIKNMDEAVLFKKIIVFQIK